MKACFFLVFLVLSACLVRAADVACGKLASATDVAICENPDLSARDKLLSAAIGQVSKAAGPELASAVATLFSQRRESCGGDVACIAEVQYAALDVFAELGSGLAANPERARITYGGKAPMKVTVTHSSGLGTRNAIINVAHLRSDASGLCQAFQSERADCVESVLNTPLATAITADCETGAFTTLYGQSLQYAEVEGEALISDSRTGGDLAAAQASGFYAALEQFQALCPNRVLP